MWTGGEYVYGCFFAGNPATLNTQTTVHMDGLLSASAANLLRGATLHIDGFPDMAASTKWGVVSGDKDRAPGNDTSGVERAIIQGGFRMGPDARAFGQFEAAASSGFQPGYPLTLFYVQNDTVGNDEGFNRIRQLGCIADVVGTSLVNIPSKTIITVGSDDWYFFPTRRRSDDGGVATRTHFQGLAYKKVTA